MCPQGRGMRLRLARRMFQVQITGDCRGSRSPPQLQEPPLPLLVGAGGRISPSFQAGFHVVNGGGEIQRDPPLPAGLSQGRVLGCSD